MRSPRVPQAQNSPPGMGGLGGDGLVMDSTAWIARIAGEKAQQLGFRYWAYSAWTDEPRERIWSVHNVPADLWAAYLNVQSDGAAPHAPHSNACLLPMMLDLEHLPEPVAQPAAPTDWLLKLVRDYGIACGLQLPLYASGRLVATLMLAAGHLVCDTTRQLGFRRGMSLLSELHELCAPQLRQLCPLRRRPLQSALTARERECLKWASLGKTSWEIGRLVDISEHTARFHLRNACRKLSASNRQQAVAKAIQGGILA